MNWEQTLKDKLDTLPTGLSFDSRTVQAGDLFVAIEGTIDDGHNYIDQAYARGAIAVIGLPKHHKNHEPYIEHPNPRLAVSQLARYFFPKAPSHRIAVTGTNGKTSVTHFVSQLLNLLEIPCASIGTLGVNSPLPLDTFGSLVSFSSLTTPDPIYFARLMNTFKSLGIDAVSFEASSHGLDQQRFQSFPVQAAGFTNLTPEHLDHHQTMEQYGKAKLRLFTEVLEADGTAVLNQNDPFSQKIAETITQNILWYGGSNSQIQALAVKPLDHQIKMDLKINDRLFKDCVLNLTGTFQVENVLCALGLVISSFPSISLDSLIKALPMLEAPKGRMEWLGSPFEKGGIYVDYAHTPNALERSLEYLRTQTLENLWVVFGCGGDRDKSKRPLMGEIAAKLADFIIVTDDNPRSEDPAQIRTEILKKAPKALEIGDRKEAIETAISSLKSGDSLLIAGKGHEQGQVIKGKTHPFSDHAVVKDYLLKLKNSKRGS